MQQVCSKWDLIRWTLHPAVTKNTNGVTFHQPNCSKGTKLVSGFFYPNWRKLSCTNFNIICISAGALFLKTKTDNNKKTKTIQKVLILPNTAQMLQVTQNIGNLTNCHHFNAWLATEETTGTHILLFDTTLFWYYTIWKGVGSFRNISTQLRDICLKLEVKHTGCDQTLMLAWKLLGANISLWVNEYVVLPRNMA